MKTLVILAVLLCATAQAQTPNFTGGEVGCIIQKGEYPEIAYAITQTFTLEKVPLVGKLLGGMATGWEASALYADRDWEKAPEMLAARLFQYKAAYYNGWFIGVGFGGWDFLNTDGPDIAKIACKVGLGYARGPLILRIAGDIVSEDGPNMYFVHGGIVFNL